MASEAPDLDLEPLLDFLRTNRGCVFSGYKRTTLTRRVQRRMEAVGISAHEAYFEQLSTDADEFTSLFDTQLITVTRFLRDISDGPSRISRSRIFRRSFGRA